MNQILPRFTIRSFLWITAALAVLSIAVSGAIGGNRWAQGMTLGVAFLGLVFSLFSLIFAMAFVASSRHKAVQATSSPFAGQDPPDQVMVPIENFSQL